MNYRYIPGCSTCHGRALQAAASSGWKDGCMLNKNGHSFWIWLEDSTHHLHQERGVHQFEKGDLKGGIRMLSIDFLVGFPQGSFFLVFQAADHQLFALPVLFLHIVHLLMVLELLFVFPFQEACLLAGKGKNPEFPLPCLAEFLPHRQTDLPQLDAEQQVITQNGKE